MTRKIASTFALPRNTAASAWHFLATAQPGETTTITKSNGDTIQLTMRGTAKHREVLVRVWTRATGEYASEVVAL